MAVTLLQRPEGRILSTTEVTATVSSSSGALFTKVTHGLSTGNFIFIDSTLSAYNGYWYVEVIDPDTFKIREYATAAVQSYVNSGTVSYYFSVQTHNWSCVHLPIVYKLSSSLWPTNTADTARTVSSITNDAGYVNLNLSGDIKATGSAAELEFVQVFGQNAGIYQIINWISDSDITIDFPYSAGVSFSASTVQYYYSDYHARIKVYAGLPNTHTWAAQKPYELVATIKAVPDSDGIININIADYVKSKIEVDKNDTTLDTLPNDINSFCSFYIEYAEAYTFSNGYSLGTYVSSYTDDSSNFEGYAINAQLPFKTQSSGFMSEYVMTDGSPLTTQKFLTTMNEPVMFGTDQYFDVSFILNSDSGGFYVLEQYLNSARVVQTSTATAITDYDIGVYRFSPTWDSLYSYVRVTVFDSANNQISESLDIRIDNECANYYTDLVWKNYLGGHDYWRFNAGNQLSFKKKTEEAKKNIYTNWPKSYGKFADTINRQTMVESTKSYLIRSQFVTNQQAEDIINGAENSILVQIQTTETDKRTVMLEGSNTLEETDRFVELQFRLTFTDNYPVQSL